MERRTKIIATIGPATQSEDMIHQLLESGVNVARLNLSHGSHADHTTVYNRLRAVAKTMNIPLCILLDLQGPKLRIGNLPCGSISLEKGQVISITSNTSSIGADEIPVDFDKFEGCVHPGGRILLDDGNLELLVDKIIPNGVIAHVIIGGVLKSHKGISLPEAHFDISALTEKDLIDLAFGIKLGVDVIALSFVRTKKDILILREKIHEIATENVYIPVIAKLERPEALQSLDEIMEASDGVMVARGDLGVEMSPQEVPIAQKHIIECANRSGKYVITATQMLESMINSPRPTRAEASDVANAIFDGTDAVMLSGETAVGKFPIHAVEMMDKIICQAEEHVEEWGHWHGSSVADSQGDDTKFMSLAVKELAHDRNVAAIAVFTMSGRTAKYVSKTRPGVPILAFTPDLNTYNRLEMYWGVTPYLISKSLTVEDLLADVDNALIEANAVALGQQIVFTCGFPVATINPTNLVLLHTIKNRNSPH
jgi:pyruvate kinase